MIGRWPLYDDIDGAVVIGIKPVSPLDASDPEASSDVASTPIVPA